MGDPAAAPFNHSTKVVFDERAMDTGVELLVEVARRYLAAAAAGGDRRSTIEHA